MITKNLQLIHNNINKLFFHLISTLELMIKQQMQ